jgi:PAS domain S-box-containing protein
MNSEQKNKAQLLQEIAELKARMKTLETENSRKIAAEEQDIAQQKNIAEQLKESEEKFRILSETTPSAIMIYQNNKWVYVNKSATEISGFSRSELLKMNFWDFVHPEYVDKVKSLGMKRQKDIKAQKNYEFKIITKSGKHKWVWLNGASTSFRGKPAGIISVEDITERKLAEKSLAESEERFKFLSQATFEGVVVHRSGIVLDSNDAFLKLTGYQRDEIIGANLLDHIPSLKDKSRIFANMIKQKADPYIVTGKRKDNSRFCAELEAKNVKWQGKTVRIVAVRDVTARIESEKRENEIRKRYISMFHSAPISIWEADFSGVYEYIEEKKKKGVKNFPKYFTDNPEEITFCAAKVKILDVNKTTVSIFKAKTKKKFQQNLTAIFTKNTPETFQEQLISIANHEKHYAGRGFYQTFDGDQLNIHIRWNTVPGSGKNYSRVLVSFSDETAKEKALKALNDSKMQMNAIMNDPSTFIGILEPDGIIRTVNESALAFIGKSLAEVKGMKFWDSPWWEHSSELKQKLQESIIKAQNGETIRFEADHLGINSQKIFVNFSIRPVIDKNGKLDSLIAEGLNMTKQKMAEEKISKLLAEKDILLHEVHHRIKNNMANIESLFKIESRITNDEKTRNAFNDAISRLRSMRILYDKLYRSENYRQTSLQQYLPMLVNDIINIFPESSDINIQTEIADIIISADLNFPVCIIVNELLSNAMKYAFNNKNSKKIIEVSAQKTSNQVTITIQDNGVGLKPDFDMENSGGYGIELVRNLVKQIRGDISYESNQGTKWTLKFAVDE